MTMKFRRDDPARQSLPFNAWPEVDRCAWEAAQSSGDVLEGTVGAAHHWRPSTRSKNRNGYGRWLTFLIGSGRLVGGQPAEERVTEESVRAYIAELQMQDVSSWTLWARLVELHSMITAMAPKADFKWLCKVTRRFASLREARREKLARLQPAHEILCWALGRMGDLRDKVNHHKTAIEYRDALQIALLSSCPIRLSNLSMMVLDRHLIRADEGFLLRFSGSETKSHRPVVMPVPDCLAEPLDHYINVVRPLLLEGGAHTVKDLWISGVGTPLRRRSIQQAMARITANAFGHPINPHLFRDCAATFVALEDPEHVGIVSPLLGHVDHRTAEAHYVQANQISAGRRLRRSVASLRDQLFDHKGGMNK